MGAEAAYRDELARLVDRLRSMSLVRLAGQLPPYSSRADAVRELIAEVAQSGLSWEGMTERPVPRLGDESVGDQLAVVGADLVAVCSDEAVLQSFSERFKNLRVAL